MKFLIDAQLPPSLKQVFIAAGYECLHTLDLPLHNDTPDHEINRISVEEHRVLISKDNDFYDSLVVKGAPFKLILVKLGNTSKSELVGFFKTNFAEIIEQISQKDLLVLKKH